MLFFQLMTRRDERASTVLTSNKGFEEWGDIFGDDVMAAALIDRLVHHCHLVTIRGNSYRMRQHSELWQTLNALQDPEPAARRRRSRQEAAPANCGSPPRRSVRFSIGGTVRFSTGVDNPGNSRTIHRSHQNQTTMAVLVCLSPVTFGAQNQTATVRVQVRSSEKPVEDAAVVVAGTTHRTDAAGTTTISIVPGTVEITVLKSGFAPTTTSVQVAGGATQDVVVELQIQPTLKETVTVVASTRTDKRLEDQPMRVEVLAREEIEEKMLMTLETSS